MAQFSVVPPYQPANLLLDATRTSCRALREHENIRLNAAAIDELLDRIPSTLVNDPKWLESGYKLPLAYSSEHVELNVLSHLCFLNSLSGYREDFHRATGQGAHNNIVRLVLSLYLSDHADSSETPLSARTLRSLTPSAILGFWGVPTHIEKPHPDLPGVTVGTKRQDGLSEAAEVLCQAANDTGARLEELQCVDLGAFIERTLIETAREAKSFTEQPYDNTFAALSVDKITSALPAFNDAFQHPVVGPVYVHKRAYLLLSWVKARFGGEPNTQIPAGPSSAVLPAFVDNVIPSLLVHWGVLDLRETTDSTWTSWAQSTESLNSATPSTDNDAATATLDSSAAATETQAKSKVVPGPTLTLQQAYTIRAAALDACHAITERAHERAKADEKKDGWMAGMTEALVDGYIWTIGKDPRWRNVPRMVERRTFMY